MKAYNTPKEVYKTGKEILNKTVRDFIPSTEINSIEESLSSYRTNRKGFLGDLVEKYVFDIPNNSRPEADFNVAGVELKTSPLVTHKKKKYVAKERLVFSSIDYEKVINENWENSSFLKKNKLILLLLYLYEQDKSLLDYEFKYAELLDLLNEFSKEDIVQIKEDWEFIVNKIKKGEAHLLSEGDTFYLGACTKAKDSHVLRDQPMSSERAKPRAFCFKQSYLSSLVQKSFSKNLDDYKSIYQSQNDKDKTIEEVIGNKISKYIGKSDTQILNENNWEISKGPKQYKRLLVNMILTNSSKSKILELEQANIVLRVLTLEPNGELTESISFPAFDYKKLQNEEWENSTDGSLAKLHELLETKKFLFVVFQKVRNSSEVILRRYKFWNFPQEEMHFAKEVFEKTKECINNGTYNLLPKKTETYAVHVRPHGRNGQDKIETPQGGREVRKCFWLNAKYIEKVISQKGI